MSGAAGRRPNVLLLMVDQLAAAWLPAYGGGRAVRAPPDGAGARGRDVRAGLLRVAAVRPVARGDAHGPPAVGDGRLRQRRRMARVRPDRRPRAAGRRLRDGARREDALRRARPAARVRGAPDDRRLSGELRLDARLAALGRDAAPVVPQHREPSSGGRARVGDADRLRRRGVLPRRPQAPRAGKGRRRPAVLPHRLVHEPARSMGGAGSALGSLRRAWTWAEPRRARRRIHTACACARCAASTSGR